MPVLAKRLPGGGNKPEHAHEYALAECSGWLTDKRPASPNERGCQVLVMDEIGRATAQTARLRSGR